MAKTAQADLGQPIQIPAEVFLEAIQELQILDSEAVLASALELVEDSAPPTPTPVEVYSEPPNLPVALLAQQTQPAASAAAVGSELVQARPTQASVVQGPPSKVLHLLAKALAVPLSIHLLRKTPIPLP